MEEPRGAAEPELGALHAPPPRAARSALPKASEQQHVIPDAESGKHESSRVIRDITITVFFFQTCGRNDTVIYKIHIFFLKRYFFCFFFDNPLSYSDMTSECVLGRFRPGVLNDSGCSSLEKKQTRYVTCGGAFETRVLRVQAEFLVDLLLRLPVQVPLVDLVRRFRYGEARQVVALVDELRVEVLAQLAAESSVVARPRAVREVRFRFEVLVGLDGLLEAVLERERCRFRRGLVHDRDERLEEVLVGLRYASGRKFITS